MFRFGLCVCRDVFGCSPEISKSQKKERRNKMSLENIELEFIKGEPISISKALKNHQPMVIEFWATWCPPCRQTIPHLTQLAHKFTDIVFIGVTNEPADGN